MSGTEFQTRTVETPAPSFTPATSNSVPTIEVGNEVFYLRGGKVGKGQLLKRIVTTELTEEGGIQVNTAYYVSGRDRCFDTVYATRDEAIAQYVKDTVEC